MSEDVLRLTGVRKSFPSAGGAVEVLRGVDLVLSRGEFVALTGPSGSGKSTLLHLCALLDRPTAGTVQFEGHPVDALDADARAALRAERIGMVFQRFHLLPHRSVLENVLFRFRYVRAPPADAWDRARAALAATGLSGLESRRARLLSGGEMQRVALARALALRPSLLVADEPTGNLDRAATDRVMDLLREQHRSGLTILFVTHNDRLLSYATRHVACSDGRLLEQVCAR